MAARNGVRLSVDWTSCVGHRYCEELLPERITLDEWGYPLVSDEPVPTELVRLARRAAADCPVLALKLTDATGGTRMTHATGKNRRSRRLPNSGPQ